MLDCLDRREHQRVNWLVLSSPPRSKGCNQLRFEGALDVIGVVCNQVMTTAFLVVWMPGYRVLLLDKVRTWDYWAAVRPHNYLSSAVDLAIMALVLPLVLHGLVLELVVVAVVIVALLVQHGGLRRAILDLNVAAVAAESATNAAASAAWNLRVPASRTCLITAVSLLFKLFGIVLILIRGHLWRVQAVHLAWMHAWLWLGLGSTELSARLDPTIRRVVLPLFILRHFIDDLIIFQSAKEIRSL